VLKANYNTNTINSFVVFSQAAGMLCLDNILDCMPPSIKELNIDLCYVKPQNLSLLPRMQLDPNANDMFVAQHNNYMHPLFHRLSQLTNGINIGFQDAMQMVPYTMYFSQHTISAKYVSLRVFFAWVNSIQVMLHPNAFLACDSRCDTIQTLATKFINMIGGPMFIENTFLAYCGFHGFETAAVDDLFLLLRDGCHLIK
jgi:hypothetical protein